MLLKGIKEMKTKNITFRDAYSGRFLTNCQIKVLKEPNKPIVVEFIQLPVPNYGTTITNTISSLAKQEIEIIKKETNLISINDFAHQLFCDCPFSIIFNLRLGLIEFLFNFFKRNIIDICKTRNNINNIIWVEHYPANTYFFKYDKYAIITFDKTFNEPDWEHLTLENLAKRTGYRKSDFEVIK